MQIARNVSQFACPETQDQFKTTLVSHGAMAPSSLPRRLSLVQVLVSSVLDGGGGGGVSSVSDGATLAGGVVDE